MVLDLDTLFSGGVMVNRQDIETVQSSLILPTLCMNPGLILSFTPRITSIKLIILRFDASQI